MWAIVVMLIIFNIVLGMIIVALVVKKAGAQELAPCGPFGSPQFHCAGGDCENGILDAYRLQVPDDVAICNVDFFFTGSSIPVARWKNGCDQGLCTFGLPFGPELRAYSQPHDPSVVGIRVWTDPRRRLYLPIMKGG
jgi:hypothetical protein